LRYLILSDIHSNLEALQAVMAAAKGKYNELLCLGDLVGYGPDPNAVITSLRTAAQVVIRGNHDKACSGLIEGEDFNVLARASTRWTRAQLTPQHLDYLRSLPAGPLTVDRFDIVHGSPADEDHYLLGPAEAVPALRALTLQLVFFGHTHHQGGFSLTPAGNLRPLYPECGEDGEPDTMLILDRWRYLINPGSVGQPRDGDWRAAFLIFNDDTREVEFYRVPYELASTQAKMEAAALPDQLIQRLENGR
jgi:diadenosine tetraphosphatase ApaH/serine/threonine PP2A family protein phosphatase